MHLDLDGDTGFEEFKEAATRGNVVPMHERIFSDHLTPVLAYRCLVRQDDRSAPSFLFEAVNNGTQQVPHMLKLRSFALAGNEHVCLSITYVVARIHVNSSTQWICRVGIAMWVHSHQLK